MPTFLLPKLSENAAIAPVTAGQWEQVAIAGHFLKGMADGLAVAAQEKKTESIDSIPDIWARPILFKMALYDAGHKNFDAGLHEKVQGEWRALLAMLALQERQHLPLTAEEVHLGNVGANGALGDMLLSLAPKDSADGQEKAWNDIYVISYNGVPLAITSPLTLIAVAADYSTALSGQLTQPWSSDGKYLTDPLPYLSTSDLNGLYLWLKELDDNLSKSIPLHVKENNETCDSLFKSLRKYMQDVQDKLGGNFAPAGNLIDSGLSLHIGLAGLLNQKLDAKPFKPEDSAVMIRTSVARNSAKSLLLVSPKVLQDLSVSRGWPMAQLEVWAGITAVNIDEKSFTGGKQSLNGVSLGDVEWRRPEDFFTERLAIQEGSNAFPGTLKVQGSEALASEEMSVILPLKPEILDYFTPQEIAQNCYVEKKGNEIKVQFTFPLSGMDGKGINYTVEKSYPMQEVIYLINNIPVIEIWPNFKSAGWKQYYLYYENSEAQNQTDTVGRDFFYVYPWAYGQEIAGDTPNKGLANRYTARLSDFPEVLICTVNQTVAGGVDIQSVEAGLILLAEPQAVIAQMGLQWQIGIDFGTSSTMLYYREGKKDPKPLALQPNLFQVTDSGVMRNRTYRNFIPSSTSDQKLGSFLSIFQLFGNMDDHKVIRPLQDGNVFWLLSADGEDADDFRLNSGRIDTNLKWRNDLLGRMKVAAYVEQICLQSVAEAVKEGIGAIDWNFSYPTAFSEAQQMTFNATCKAAVNNIMKDAGFDIKKGVNVKYWPESQASAYTFYHMSGNHFAGGAICLDIGAGTTDVSIISEAPARIVYHTSLQFAGRYLFRSLYQNYDIFTDGTLKFDGMYGEQKNALIDADLRKHSQDYLESLLNLSGQSDVQKVLQIAQFSLAGIFYYLGSLLQVLHERGIYQSDEIPEVYVGGNGSRILHWICGGMFDEDNPFLLVFKDILLATSGLSADWGFQLELSKKPKVEVACGMVSDYPLNHKDFFDENKIAKELFGIKGKDLLIANSMFAGDAFFLPHEGVWELKEKTEFISAYEISEGIRLQNVKELQRFAEVFNENSHIWGADQPISFSDKELAKVAKAVLGSYAAQTGCKPTGISVEPIFILELKKFMEMLC